MIRLGLALVLLLAGIPIVPAAARQAASTAAIYPVSAWSERGVFSFGDLAFDFFYGRWQIGVFGGALVDCSNESYRCLDSREFQLVLPRRCEEYKGARVGTAWAVGGVRTEVLGTADEGVPVHGAGGRKLYLGNPATPHLLYQYDARRGVEMILMDERERADPVDFVALARAGQIGRWLYGSSTDPTKANKIYRLSTLDPFGRCGPITPLRELDVRRPTTIDQPARGP